MKTELLNIINNADEPVYELDSYIAALEPECKKDIAWKELKQIALSGKLQQRFIALTVISENKPIYLEQLTSELIGEKHFAKNELILKPIVNICSTLMKEEHISFMQDVLDYAAKNDKEFLYELTLRNLLATSSWENVIEELIKVVSTSDELTIVDLLAFFINEQGIQGYQSLVKHFPSVEQRKVNELDKKIKKRLKDGYQNLK
ncbi:hypothetical protein SAMN06265379_101952 [Saccharicrinis carchari]|uniref:Uncharacterized protein n=1 Tax=Saccharicrinis carchari TaxID=1168039 RepID=A0A521BIN2_SACCC|nr:hypothetical protein [Saccharicrinis carchari]SMO46751.1 hypothetical protein SAMN06265379_101952 [Saccharicrinis carchari]